jgi:hypothetical protein
MPVTWFIRPGQTKYHNQNAGRGEGTACIAMFVAAQYLKMRRYVPIVEPMPKNQERLGEQEAIGLAPNSAAASAAFAWGLGGTLI